MSQGKNEVHTMHTPQHPAHTSYTCDVLYAFADYSALSLWHLTPVLLPRKSHGRRSLVGCSPWGRYSRTRLSDFTYTFHFHALEKEMATHSSVLAWRFPGTRSLVGCCLWGRTESDTTEATQQHHYTTRQGKF